MSARLPGFRAVFLPATAAVVVFAADIASDGDQNKTPGVMMMTHAAMHAAELPPNNKVKRMVL